MCSLAYKEGDIRLHDYLGKTDDDQLYELEYIVDERRRGAVRQFRVKWKVCTSVLLPLAKLIESLVHGGWKAH